MSCGTTGQRVSCALLSLSLFSSPSPPLLPSTPPCFPPSLSLCTYLPTWLRIHVEARGLCQVSPSIILYLKFWDRVSYYPESSLIYLHWMEWMYLRLPWCPDLQHRGLAAILCLGGLWQSELRLSCLQVTNISTATSPQPLAGFTYAGVCLGGLFYVVPFVHSSFKIISLYLYLSITLASCWGWAVVLGGNGIFLPWGDWHPFLCISFSCSLAVINWRRSPSLCCQ